jgi:hypothetical protein
MISRNSVALAASSRKSTFGWTSYFHWMFAIRSRRRSNSWGERDVQNFAMRLAISRRAASIASALRRLVIGGADQALESKKRDFAARILPRNALAQCCSQPPSWGRGVYRLLVGVALETRVSLRPAMHLMAGWTFDGVHLFDRRRLERFRIHRVTGVDHFPGVWTLDDDAVHPFLDALELLPCLQRRFRRRN